MGQTNILSTDDKFLSKEENPFYVETKKEMKSLNYTLGKIEKKSESEIILPFSYEDINYELNIQNYKFGILRITFDLKDKTLKYKNKVDIGSNLIKEKFETIIEEKDRIILISKDGQEESVINSYKIIINLINFELDYYINDILLFSLNKQKSLNLIYKNDKSTSKYLKSNTIDFTYYNIDKLFGLAERLSPLFLEDRDYRLYNLNACLKAKSPKSLYGSIPMLHGVNKNHILTLFNNNSSDQIVEIKTENNNSKNISWFMEGGIIDLYITSDSIYYRNHKKLAEITGYAIMPPLWSLGYHQCRWGYKNDEDVINTEKKFNELNIPFDCFWFDIEHTDQKKYFTWDPKNFGNIKPFLDKLNSEHRYFVTIIDPHIKKDENYDVCNYLKENDAYVKKAKTDENSNELVNYEGGCWPGNSYFVDFINYDKVLPLYKHLYETSNNYFYDFKNFGTWVDMNEPSVFTFDKYEEMSMPKNNIHNDGSQLIEHREIHNIYGYYYQKVAYESLKNKLGNNTRAFVLTRSFYAGSQRNGFVWTGDQGSSFDYLNSSIEANMVNSLCGISGTGSDIGGFCDNPTPEVLKAWYCLGNFYPFFRGHSSCTTLRREPWVYEKDICESIIESIRLRYHLLMYVYTKFYEHCNNGIPLLKPMWMKFRENYDDFINMEEQGSLFVFGDELIGCNGYTVDDKYIDKLINKLNIPIYTLKGEKFSKKEEKNIQMLFIGGNIIPWIEKAEKCSYYVKRSPVTLKIFLDKNKYSIGHYYLDDGISIDNKNEFIYMVFEFKEKILKAKCLNKLDNIESKPLYETIPIFDKIEIYGFGKINDIKSEFGELKIQYKEENDCNIIDLIENKIKVCKDFELQLS